jgi:hypothetical protein
MGLDFFTPERGVDPRSIIDSLICNTVPITLVDPRLFCDILPYLLDYLADARMSSHHHVMNRIEDMIKYIDEEPMRAANSAILEEPVPQPVVKPPALTDDEVDAEVRWIWQHRQIRSYPPDELELVVAGFRQKSSDFIGAGDYLNAEKSGQYAQILISHGQLGTVELIESERVKDSGSSEGAGRREGEVGAPPRHFVDHRSGGGQKAARRSPPGAGRPRGAAGERAAGHQEVLERAAAAPAERVGAAAEPQLARRR